VTTATRCPPARALHRAPSTSFQSRDCSLSWLDLNVHVRLYVYLYSFVLLAHIVTLALDISVNIAINPTNNVLLRGIAGEASEDIDSIEAGSMSFSSQSSVLVTIPHNFSIKSWLTWSQKHVRTVGRAETESLMTHS
jgi:hypothetical protein